MFRQLIVLLIALVMLAGAGAPVAAQELFLPSIHFDVHSFTGIPHGCEGGIGTVHFTITPFMSFGSADWMIELTIPAKPGKVVRYSGSGHAGGWTNPTINVSHVLENNDFAGPHDTVHVTIHYSNYSGPNNVDDLYVYCATGTYGWSFFENHQFTADAVEQVRVNHRDVAAPVAAYLIEYASGTGLHHYAVDSAGHGSLALEVTPEMIAAVPEHPDHNTLIASSADGKISLYRLTTGEFQINAPDYVTVFKDLQPGTYHYSP